MRSPDGGIRARLKDAFAGRRLVVTGGASFIGSHLVKLLAACDAEITVADDLSSSRRENLGAVESQITFLKGDLREPAFAGAVMDGQDLVFHLAASHGGRGYTETRATAGQSGGRQEPRRRPFQIS